ncbi:hypothetical protein F220043C3_32740 [Enterocloster asparagiformis]
MMEIAVIGITIPTVITIKTDWMVLVIETPHIPEKTVNNRMTIPPIMIPVVAVHNPNASDIDPAARNCAAVEAIPIHKTAYEATFLTKGL